MNKFEQTITSLYLSSQITIKVILVLLLCNKIENMYYFYLIIL